MTRVHLVVAAALAVAAASHPAHAAGKVYCQNPSLRVPGTSCTTVTGKWNPANTLHFTASCRECTGSGANLNCSTAELISASNLELQNASYKKVAGTFSKLGVCDFSVDLFRFGGTLDGNTTYHIVANIAGHGATLVMSFSTTGGGTNPGSDGGGTNPGSDGGGTNPGSDGGGTNPGSDGSGSGTGDGGGTSTPPPADEAGCGCRAAGDGAAGGLGALLVLCCLGLLARRRR